MIQSPLLSSFTAIRHAFTVKDHLLNGMDDELVMPTQIHSDIVTMVSPGDKKVISDGLITTLSNLPIGIITSDCVPVLLYDPEHHSVSAIHAGWRGTLDTIVRNAVQSMIANGSNVHSLIAAIGPAIKSCCYDISPERAQLFSNKFGTNSVIWIDERPYIDLQDINYHQLFACGLLPEHIDLLPECTKCNEAYYSYRRGDRDKRMISYIYSL